MYIQSGTAWAPVMGTDPGLKDNTWLSFSQYPYFVTSQPGIKALDARDRQILPRRSVQSECSLRRTGERLGFGDAAEGCAPSWGLQAGTAPTTAVLLKGLYTMKNQTLGGLVPPLTFKKGQGSRRELLVRGALGKWDAASP